MAVVGLSGWAALQHYLNDPMRAWVGEWTTDNVFQNLQAHWTLDIGWNHDYTSAVETRDAGNIRFNGSQLSMETGSGQTIRGYFRFEGPNTAQISGPLGSATWTRDAKSASAGTDSPAGTWTATRVVNNMPWTLTFQIGDDGKYDLRTRAEDSGRFAVDDRRWHLYSTRGAPQEGTYQRIDGRTVSMRGPLGTAVWARK